METGNQPVPALPRNDSLRAPMKQDITFILPTRNRRDFVRRAIDSCLRCESETVSPYVIVIDGESDDGTFIDLQNAYRDDKRVRLLQNSKTAGFMNTCFEGVELVKSKWVTFMYDDDLLSPYFIHMVHTLVRSPDDFVMGYGATFTANEIYPFEPIAEYRRCKPEQLILTYYGRNTGVEHRDLPHSPICCVTTSNLLREWVQHVRRFCSANPLRQYFMLKQNIGPDLMIYLLSLLNHRGDVPVALAVVAQFSTHSDSMSIRYGSNELAVGYWLAKIWAFEQVCQSSRRSEAAICGSAIILIGAKILAIRWSRFQVRWSASIIREIFDVVVRLIRNQMVLRSVKEGCLHMLQWTQTRSSQSIP